jgi:hypothetical protein
MSTVADALRQHRESYLAEFGKRMPSEHKRVLALVTRCRTGELGHLLYQCQTVRNNTGSGEAVAIATVPTVSRTSHNFGWPSGWLNCCQCPIFW